MRRTIVFSVAVAVLPFGGASRSTTLAKTPTLMAASRTAYVATYVSNTVTPIDTVTNTAGRPIPVGSGPSGIAIKPNGATAYVANEDNNSVTPINTTTNTAGTPISVGGEPTAIAIA